MFGTLFDKVTGLFDKRFTLALLLPVFAFAAGTAALAATMTGWHQTVTWWSGLDAARQVATGVAAGAAVVVLAVIAGTQVVAMTRVLEGYWRWAWANRTLGRLGRWHEEKRRDDLARDVQTALDTLAAQAALATQAEQAEQPEQAGKAIRAAAAARVSADLAYQRSFLAFPPPPGPVMPTRLGNALRAAAAYSADEERWGIDGEFWWPRLYLVLPDSARAQVDDARAALDQLVVLTMLSAAFSLVALGLSCAGLNLAVGLGCAGGAVLLSRGCYLAAVTSATVLGDLMRSCYDMFRGDLLARLGWPMPPTLRRERQLWTALGQQFYRRGTSNEGDALVNAPRQPPAPPPPSPREPPGDEQDVRR